MKVYPLQIGYTKVPYGQFYGGLEGWIGLKGVWRFATDKKHFIKVPIHVYLIEHPHHGPILVDAGISAEQAREHDQYYRGIMRLILDSDEYELPPEQELPAQLKLLGYECKDIRNVILSHLHEDHVGCLKYFPNATVMVPKTEWDGRHDKLLGLLPLYYQPSISMVKNWSLIEFSSGEFGATYGQVSNFPCRRLFIYLASSCGGSSTGHHRKKSLAEELH